MINQLMREKNFSIYRLAKNSGVPYTTVNDICSGNAQLEKCSGETIYKIAKALEVSMESLIAPCLESRINFELFKSNTCHRLKELGDLNFLIELLEEDEIQKYHSKKWYPECLYLLAMLDYISRINNIPLCTRYNHLRRMKLKKTLYPASVLVTAKVMKDNQALQNAVKESIPEFLQFNIVESEVHNVV